MAWFSPKKPVTTTVAADAVEVEPRAAATATPETPAVARVELPVELPRGATAAVVPAVVEPAEVPVVHGGHTRLSADTTVIGGIETASDLWIGGRIEGDIASGGAVHITTAGAVVGCVHATTVRVDPGGGMHGPVVAQTVSISGIVEGSIRAASRLSISSTGRVFGDVSAGSMEIDDGATLQGRCLMLPRR